MREQALAAWRIVWTGDASCRAVAELLSDDHAIRAGSDVWSSLVDARATLHVTPHLQTMPRCSVAVPHEVDVDGITSVVAAVGGGPHSGLAAATAQRIAMRLDVPASVITGYRSHDQRRQANRALLDIAESGIDLPMRAVETQHPPDLVAALPEGSLVVIGAPGGSWFQRQLFGAGARFRAAAPGGVVIVRHDSRRVYQVMTTPVAVGTAMRVRDVLELTSEPIVLVADQGRLSGMVRRRHLLGLEPHVAVGTVAEPPLCLAAEEPVDQVQLVLDEHGGGPVGVVDRRGKLIGAVTSESVANVRVRADELAS